MRRPWKIESVFAVAALCLALFLSCAPLGRRIAVALFSPVAEMASAGVRGVMRLLPGSRTAEKNELARLRCENASLATAAAEALELRRQNAQLRAMLKLAPPPGWRAVATQVIGRDPAQWNEVMTVDRGYDDGVATGAAVLLDGALFGRVLKSDRHCAQIVTLTSPQCRLGVRLEAVNGHHPAVAGVMRGAGMQLIDGQRGFVVDFLPPVLDVMPGELLLTSGLGGWLPDGLPVGRTVPDAEDGDCLHVIDTARGELHCLPVVQEECPVFLTVLSPKGEG